LYHGPAPESLRSAFGLDEPKERLVRGAAAVGIELDSGLSTEEAEVVLVLNAIGSRWASGEEKSLAELTGLSVRQLSLLRQDAIREGLLRPDGRLTERGHVTRRAGVTAERKRPAIPTSLMPYYPMQLRVPR
jgi:hypothetical protein